jgi:hypothetical protein
MRIRFLGLLALPLLLLAAGGARADFTFQYTDGSGNTVTSNSFSVAQGSTINIRVYLLETNGETRLQSPGLISGGAQLNYNQSIANVTTLTGNSSFNNTVTPSIGTGNAAIRETSTTAVTAPSSGTDANRILLGTFTFTGVSAGSTLVKTSIPDAGTSVSDNVLNDSPTFTSIDGLINLPNASITVTAVPEPGSLALSALCAGGMCGLLVRRLRRPKAA